MRHYRVGQGGSNSHIHHLVPATLRSEPRRRLRLRLRIRRAASKNAPSTSHSELNSPHLVLP
jgi:hypothetical protein